MSLIINKNNPVGSAHKDIRTFKVLMTNTKTYKEKIFSPLSLWNGAGRLDWEEGECKEIVNFTYSKRDGSRRVMKGLYSFESIDFANKFRQHLLDWGFKRHQVPVYVSIIPKNTIYRHDPDSGEYVSLKLQLRKPLIDLD